ncbi:MAG: winged helix-turn-helix domain-containing protein, partial [Devosiaceae bacterium]|nr:winged helix-turn-helix domain-containing protein [Devosiaceae bacterium]
MKQSNKSNIAKTFAALGNEKRLGILEFLLNKLPVALTFGEVQKATKIPPSTLSHHLQEMEQAKILIREPSGTSTSLHLDLNYLQSVLNSLMEQCC